MTTFLRKRHSLQSMQHSSDAVFGGSSSFQKPRYKRNYGIIALYGAIFWSSPLFLLYLTTFPNKKSLIPIAARNLEIREGDLAVQYPQQAKLLRTANENVKTSSNKNGSILLQDHIVYQVRNNHTITDIIPTIPVVVWPYVVYGAGTAELQHFAENGIHESPFLSMSGSLHEHVPHMVWIGDFGFTFGPNRWCDAYLETIVEVQEQRRQLGLSTRWPIFIVDWRDQLSSMPRCLQMEETMGREWIHYYIRSVVSNRHWNDTLQWINVGQRMVLPKQYHHVPLFVRTDTVQALEQVLREQHGGMTLSSPIETLLKRPIHVSHFWPLDGQGVKETKHAKLRTKVSSILVNMTTISSFVGLAGSALQAGRRNVKSAYIEAMLHTKIIVVTQRDDWEDHYRLFEALVSGAMVMTDRMLSLPSGLENGISIVEFESDYDLREKILYYLRHDEERLEIAARGREVSMRQHRTFHRVEQVVFGRELSDCSRSNGAESSCPWIVHASEA